MTVYELLKAYKPLLVNMTRQGINQDDVAYLDVYAEFIRLRLTGQKEAEIYAILSQKHKLSASTIKHAVKRLNQEYELY